MTAAVSFATKPKADAELMGLVYGMTEIPTFGDVPVYKEPILWAVVVSVVLVILNIMFW